MSQGSGGPRVRHRQPAAARGPQGTGFRVCELTRQPAWKPKRKKSPLFIHGPNPTATAKSLGFDIDYKRLLRKFQSRGYLLRPFYYTAVIEDQEYSSIRPLIDWLDYNGYSVVTKATKEFV